MREPVKRLVGPSVPQMIEGVGGDMREFEENALGRFGKNLEHEIGRLLMSMGAK